MRRTPSPAAATFAAFASVLSGIGLARFAYTPLLPALIEAGWLSPAGAAWAGAANLLGYLAGALMGPWITRARDPRPGLRGMMLLVAVSLAATALPLGFVWIALWRAVSGLAGGALAVAGVSTAMAAVPPGRHGLGAGLVFTGVGLGVVGSGVLIPWLLRLGMAEAWLALAGVCLCLALAAWRGWPPEAPSPPPPRAARIFLPVHVAYAFGAVALVPHMVFLVDHIARGLGWGMAAGALQWVLFGAGATAGPIAMGLLADRIGFNFATRLVYVVEAVAVLIPALTANVVLLSVSSVLVGAFTPGIVPLTLGRLHGLGGGAGAWAMATIGFATIQALAAAGFSVLYGTWGLHAPLFILGAAALLAGVATDLALSRRRG